jgi:probable aminopeptidase NPEPL1
LQTSEVIDESKAVVDCLILIGTKDGFQQHLDWAGSQVLFKLLGYSEEEPKAKKPKFSVGFAQDVQLLYSILAGLQPSLDAGISAECYIARSEGSKEPLKVVLGVLPASVSRHNSPGQPHAITSLLKKHMRLKDVTVILPLCTSSDHLLSVACAIARIGGSLMYNRKTGSGIPVDTGAISINEMIDPSVPEVRVLFPHAIDMTMQQRFAQLSTGIQLTRRLVDQPCNELHTKAFTEQALDLIQGIDHVTSRVIKGEELKKQGFGGLYNVGKAAAHPPALVILSYEPPSTKGKKSTVFVGKGIVFDTGGTQIKTKTGMPGMKRDMYVTEWIDWAYSFFLFVLSCLLNANQPLFSYVLFYSPSTTRGGAAAILSAFVSLVRSGTVQKQPLHAVLCLAENSVASNAMRPDDVITLHSGRTVEVNNTDAEGRLVLSDGCSSAITFLNPKVIIDMATLTGAQGVATGKYFGAIYSNDEQLEKIAVEAGKLSGDLCHPLPYAPEFFRPEFASAVAGTLQCAVYFYFGYYYYYFLSLILQCFYYYYYLFFFLDMKNSVADRANAQVSCAGQFIGNHMGSFLDNGGQWMHIDMAYCVSGKDERATGYGVALLYSIVQKLESM